MGQKGLQNLIPSFAYIGQNTLACKIVSAFLPYGFLDICLDDFVPLTAKWTKMASHGCFIPSTLSIVIVYFCQV